MHLQKDLNLISAEEVSVNFSFLKRFRKGHWGVPKNTPQNKIRPKGLKEDKMKAISLLFRILSARSLTLAVLVMVGFGAGSTNHSEDYVLDVVMTKTGQGTFIAEATDLVQNPDSSGYI